MEENKKVKKPFYKRWWFWVLVVLIVIGAAGSQGGDEANKDSQQSASSVSASSAVTSQPVEDTPAVKDNLEAEQPAKPAPAEPEVTLTMGQQNALASAKSYLDFTAFSYSGLIEQLEYEGYSTEDATFAADNCGADWNEQAAKSAQSYLDFTSFSRDGLIEQLMFEGFTAEQAAYGVSAVGY